MNILKVINSTKKQMTEVTGLKTMGVTQVSKEEDGWLVETELLEMARIPPATDLIGTYEVKLDDSGDILSFERKRTRLRGEPMEDER